MVEFIEYIWSPLTINSEVELNDIEESIPLMTAVVWGSGVFKKIRENIKIDRRKFAKGPANIIKALCHLGFESKVFLIWSDVNCSFTSGSNSISLLVIIETYPPKGNADKANSDPYLSTLLYITGPIPIENRWTCTLNILAKIKWPYSWMVTRTPRSAIKDPI